MSDDGVVGTVTIGSRESANVAEARRRIELILDPPMAELGAVYQGKVVNVTKFGAFVNVLPGKDGLLHISKLGRGKRIDRVEDVLNLGDEVEVRVDDIDNSGKLSLSLVGDDECASVRRAVVRERTTAASATVTASRAPRSVASGGNGGRRATASPRTASRSRSKRPGKTPPAPSSVTSVPTRTHRASAAAMPVAAAGAAVVVAADAESGKPQPRVTGCRRTSR